MFGTSGDDGDTAADMIHSIVSRGDMNNDRGENRGKRAGGEGGSVAFFSLSPSASLFLLAGEAPDVFAAWLLSEIAISQDSSVEVNSIRIFSPPTFITFTFKSSDLACVRACEFLEL